MTTPIKVVNVIRHFGMRADKEGIVLDVVVAEEVKKGEVFLTHQLPGFFQCGQVASRKVDNRWQWIARCEWVPNQNAVTP